MRPPSPEAPALPAAESTPGAAPAEPAPPSVRLAPTLVIGTLLMAVVILIVSWAELVTGKIMIGFLQLPPVVLPLLFLLVMVNRGIGRFAVRLALTAQEVAIIFVMMVLSSMVASRGIMEDLLPTLAGINYYATAANEWAARYFPNIKPWLVPWNPGGGEQQEVARGFYEGYFHGEAIPWLVWLKPVLTWAVLYAAVIVAFLCLATILRRQWSDQERLSYPLVQLPLEMIREGDPRSSGRGFFRDPLLWSGFAIAFLVFLVKGLHQSYPTIPEIPTEINITQIFPDKPWSDLSYTVMFVSLAAVGFFFLLPTDLLLSFWFFFMFGRAQELIASMLGIEAPSLEHAGAKYFVGMQTVGAFVVLAGYLFYIGRGHWRHVARVAFGQARADDRNEMMSYRRAFWGLIGSFVVIVVWLWSAGMAPWVALLEMGGYIFVEAIIMGRAMAEGGMLMAEGSWTPLDLYGAFASRATLGPSSLTVLAFTHAMFTRDLRGMTFTAFMDGQKLAEGVNLKLRKLLVGIGVALVLAFIMAGIVELWLPYRKGAAVSLYSYAYRANNIQFWNEFMPFMKGEPHAQPDALAWLLVGGAVTAFLAFMRMRFYWWPLHPLGYAMTCSWTLLVFWFPIFIAWILKTLVIRYGGMRLYGRARPFFLGLIFGEFTCATMWTLLAIFFNLPVPSFPWP